MTAPAGPVRLAVEDVAKSFGDTAALRGVSIAFAAGEVHALLGENGAGKSTLVNIVSGNIAADAGRVLLNGEPVELKTPAAAWHAGIATIHQHKALVPQLSVVANVQLGREPQRMPGILDPRPADETLEALRLCGLEKVAGTAVARLTSGQRQLTAVARALSHRASIFLFDEPTAELGPEESEHLFEVVRQLRAAGVALAYITHRLEEVDLLADRVSVLRDGQLVMSEPASAVDRRAAVRAMAGRDIEQVFPDRDPPPAQAKAGPSAALTLRGGTDRAGRFEDVDLEVRGGEILGIVGLPDSGAVELVESLGGARRLGAGELAVNGAPVRYATVRGALRNGVAYLPRERGTRAVLGPMSTAHTVALSALHRVSSLGVVDPRAERRLASSLLDDVGVRHSALPGPLAALSGGNQQRALLARLLAAEPSVLVCEDLTAGVDIAGRSRIYGLLAELCRAGTAVVCSSGDLTEMAGLCDRILVLREGHVTRELLDEELDERAVMAAQFGLADTNPNPSTEV